MIIGKIDNFSSLPLNFPSRYRKIRVRTHELLTVPFPTSIKNNPFLEEIGLHYIHFD
jgi:hypothetical protein